MEYFVVVDTDGPVGVFSSAEKARDALEPFLKSFWRGVVLKYKADTSPEDSSVECNGEVVLLMPYRTANCHPIAVGPRKYITRYQKSIDAGGFSESLDDMLCHVADVDHIIPAASARLMPLIRPPKNSAVSEFLNAMVQDDSVGDSYDRMPSADVTFQQTNFQ